jgi:DNA mismatch repair protein MutS
VTTLSVYADRSSVELDEPTQRNLELLANMQDGSRRYTLLEVLDQTRTSPGARKLRRWILSPLKDPAAIGRRLGSVEAFYRSQTLLSRLRETLSEVLDLERLTARAAMDRAHARDLQAIRSTLDAALSLAGMLGEPGRQDALGGLAETIERNATQVRDLAGLLERAISEEPSILLTEGHLIRRGYDADLDRLHGLKDNARGILDRYLAEERAETGISSLKLRYNRILGYYFEVTKSNLGLVPQRFIRRQSLVGGERYTTDRLADLESEINDATERIVEIERTLFLEVRSRVKDAVPWLLQVCEAVSELDVFQSFAFAATLHGYCRPTVTDGVELAIRDGRHPVVEAHLPGGAFVPNSLSCPGDGRFFVLLTGPNMAGKSTFLRQVALITLMAQMGSFVPAAAAEIGAVDRVFCRVGATDNLARGESTFLVEMNETAHILHAASPRSLVIMDEIGRGTSTQDGLAIAWAVCRSLLDTVKARTLFATHFHELTQLAHPAVANLSMDVRDTDGHVVFLKRVREGPSSSSYGIHVARLAGLPRETLLLAETMLEELARASTSSVLPQPARHSGPDQEQLFGAGDLIVQELRGIQPERLTPMEALLRIARWKEELSSEKGK